MQQRIPTLDRYWAKVDKSGDCWTWTAGKDYDGYGIFWDGTYLPNGRPRYVKAHRWSYESTEGAIPAGLLVCHSCDNPSCVNPAHLWPGTHADNHRDREVKGRGATSKLTPDQVRAIRLDRAERGMTFKALGEKYGVTDGTVSALLTGRTWQHVD